MGAHDRPHSAADSGQQPPDETADDSERLMGVCLAGKLANSIDGVDLSERAVGDVFKLPASLARLLIAEGWAVEDKTPQARTERVSESDPVADGAETEHLWRTNVVA